MYPCKIQQEEVSSHVASSSNNISNTYFPDYLYMQDKKYLNLFSQTDS